MDLGIAGRTALVSAASKGLGKACALALAREGVAVTLVARTEAPLLAAAKEIQAVSKAKVQTVVADVGTDAGRATVLERIPNPDILINNPGGRPLPGDFRKWTRKDWLDAIETQMLSQVFFAQAVIDGMIAKRWGRIVNITASFVKFPQVRFAHSHGARLGLTGAMASIAREVSRHNITINAILPGVFDTDALNTNMRRLAKETGRTYEDVRAERVAQNPAGRIADPDELGQLCAYLCSDRAGFVTGQNIIIDGGVYPGVF
ncbi:MAG: SDR family oxidoreductase [Rhodospirillales bacterium]|nr:SDR family oxidoreductase [Rhodospirillales bacterium]